MADATPGLADFSSLTGILATSKLATTNPAAAQVIRGLITGATDSNKFLKSQFTDINGQQISLQQGLAATLDALNGVNGTIASLTDTIAIIQGDLATLTAAVIAEFAIRNAASFGAYAFNNAAQILTTAVSAQMVLNTDLFGSLRSGNTFVAPAAAQYLISGSVAFAPNAVGTRKVNLSSSGGLSLDLAQVPAVAVDNIIVPFVVLVSLVAAETVQANLLQDSGGNLNAQGAMQIFRVSYA